MADYPKDFHPHDSAKPKQASLGSRCSGDYPKDFHPHNSAKSKQVSLGSSCSGDWKSALAALGATDVKDDKIAKTDVYRKKRVGVVYSTNPDFEYADDSEEQTNTLPMNQQKLRLNMERAGRGGKTVTLVKGFVGADDDINALCKLLKQKCGVGGSVKEGEIIIQGDHRQRLIEILKKEGFSQAK